MTHIGIWLGPFQWRERMSSKTGLPSPAGQFGWRMPVGAMQAIDIRGPQGSETPGALSPLAIFITPGDISLDAPYSQLASDPLETLTGRARADLAAAFGRAASETRFIDVLHDLMTGHVDLSRTICCPPRVANSKGKIEWKIAGQLVKSVEVGPGTAEWAGVVARHQRIYEDLLNSGVQDLESKYLATVIAKYKLTEAQGVDIFIREGLPKKAPVKPSTTLTESFPGTSATLGGDQTWTEINGTWDNSSGTGRVVSDGNTRSARCEGTLSTDDMRVQCVFNAAAQASYRGTFSRFAAAAITGYSMTTRHEINDSYGQRVSAGTTTDIITSELGGAATTPSTDAIEVDGDQVEIFAGGISRGATTDTNISGNVRGGLYIYGEGGLFVTFDNWQAEDLAAAIAATVTLSRRPLLRMRMGMGR